MIVAIDAQLTLGTSTGIGEYVRGLVDALGKLGVEVRELRRHGLDPWRFDRRVFWDQILLPRLAARSGAQLLHCASGTMPLRRRLPAVVTVHDVAWLKVQRHARGYARYYFGPFAMKRYARAAALAVDSSFSRGELLDALPVAADRVHVVYPGVAADFCDLIRAPEGNCEIAVPGTVERRKNLEVLIRALPFEPRAKLISVGPFTAYRDECEALARSLGVEDRIEFRGYVPRKALLRLYAGCAAVATPSRYEGFGYAAAQALCAGTPAIVSDSSSLPEIAGGDARLVKANDPHEWASAMSAVLDDSDAAEAAARAVRKRAAQRFAWDQAALRMRRVYETVLG